MIIPADKKSQFTILLSLSNVDVATQVKAKLSEAGYEVFFLPDQEAIVERVRQAAPHVILFSLDVLTSPLNDFVQTVVDINNEVLFIPVASLEQSVFLMDYREYNFAAVLPQGEGLPSRTLWAVDEIIKGLYLTYQNEQIIQQMDKIRTIQETQEREIEKLQKDLIKAEPVQIKREIEQFMKAHSKEDLIQIFFRELNQRFLRRNQKIFGIYFKYLPTVQSLVATQSLGIDIENLKGVGVQLATSELGSVQPQSITKLMQEGLGTHDFVYLPLKVHKSVDGAFALWGDGFILQPTDLENEYCLFQILFERTHLIKRNESLDQTDSVTELFNRDYYLSRIEEEVARARRLQKAVSVAKLSLDHYHELEQTLGVGNRDLILRAVAQIIKKTSRVNDITCRTDDNEISLILPHCARKGALLRAERLRRLIEGHAFSISGVRVSVSAGVSEYPSLCASAVDLEKSASQALEYINGKGGNKVCLYRPMETFQPEYEVPPL